MKLFLLFAFVLAASAQDQPPAANPAPAADEAAKKAKAEMAELGTALAEGGNSPADYTRVLEAHLAKYPDSPRKADIEKALAKSAMDAKDDARIIKYGEPVLSRDPSDIPLLERVARAYLARTLLVNNDEADARKGLDWARKYDAEVAHLRTVAAPGRLTAGQWAHELDQQAARALVIESQAQGILGKKSEAVALAKRSYETWPTAEGAREWSQWLAANGDTSGAVEHLADAFTIEDLHNSEADRGKDRRRLGEIYTKANGSERGLGDLILQAYDRTSSLMADRGARLKSSDPNRQAGTILDFTLPGANGQDLKLASLKGKTIVFDFWATWCGPCKVQRPLYQQVEKKFESASNVVFLSINTDEDRALVPEFLKTQKWTNAVYYEGGLAEYLKVSSIPTTLIVGKNGEVASRMNGFIPERFVDLLTERIEDTLR